MTALSEKQLFLWRTDVQTRSRAIDNCLLATFRRNPTYAVSYGDRVEFRLAFARELRTQAERYKQKTCEQEHYGIVEGIANRLSAEHGAVLQGGRLRIGAAQKGLNLYLKYLWCLEPDRPAPPHCPIDRMVLQAAGIRDRWTLLDSAELYRDWISALRAQARRSGYASLAEWELYTWNHT